MKKKLMEILKCFLGLQSVSATAMRRHPPRDLVEFNAAKKRLKQSSKAFSREVDQFGNMVYGMQERPPKKLPPRKKRSRKSK